MPVKDRVGKLEIIWSGGAQAIREASWSIQWALEFPTMERDKAAWVSRIREGHGLDEVGICQASVLALTRLGMGRDVAEAAASAGLEPLLEAAGRVVSAETPDWSDV